MKNSETNLVQLNLRVSEEQKKTVKTAAAMTGIKSEAIMQAALNFFFDNSDFKTLKSRNACLEAFRAMGKPNSLRDHYV